MICCRLTEQSSRAIVPLFYFFDANTFNRARYCSVSPFWRFTFTKRCTVALWCQRKQTKPVSRLHQVGARRGRGARITPRGREGVGKWGSGGGGCAEIMADEDDLEEPPIADDASRQPLAVHLPSLR